MGAKIRKRGGKWYVFVNYHGRRKAKCVGTSRQLAEQVKRQLEAKLALGDRGFLTEAIAGVTFEQYSQLWVKQHAEVELKPSTVTSYSQLLRLYVLPRFGALQLTAIQRNQVKEFLGDLSAKGDLSRNTLRLVLCTLRVILNHAVEDGHIDHNPAEKLGKFSKTEKPKRQAEAMTRGEAQAFLDSATELSEDVYPLFLMALRAGLRKGELIAVRWSDIQFGATEDDSNRYILVQRNYVQGKFTTPKSKKTRRVDLSRELRRVLLELRDRRLLDAFLVGKTSIADDLVFISKVGTILDPNNLVHYHFLPCLENAGLRRFRFHDLRHTFGSLLIQAGASLTYVKEQMGHSSIQVTVDTYGHLIPGADISWIDGLDRRTTPQQIATQAQLQTEECSEPHPNGPESIVVESDAGERGRNRTYNLLIKSQLLCQLSYAPGHRNKAGRTTAEYNILARSAARLQNQKLKSLAPIRGEGLHRIRHTGIRTPRWQILRRNGRALLQCSENR
jgi:integrase